MMGVVCVISSVLAGDVSQALWLRTMQVLNKIVCGLYPTGLAVLLATSRAD
jgi:hypothetical protein